MKNKQQQQQQRKETTKTKQVGMDTISTRITNKYHNPVEWSLKIKVDYYSPHPHPPIACYEINI